MSNLSSKLDCENGVSSEHFKIAKEYLDTFITELEKNSFIIEDLKKQIQHKNTMLEEKQHEIDNFNKVSIISSLNKQITEKDNIIKKLEYQLENTKKKLIQLQENSISNKKDKIHIFNNEIKIDNPNESDSELDNIKDKSSDDDEKVTENEKSSDDEMSTEKSTDTVDDKSTENEKSTVDVQKNSIKNSNQKKKKRQFTEVKINNKLYYICDEKIYKKLKSGKISKKSSGTYIDENNYKFE